LLQKKRLLLTSYFFRISAFEFSYIYILILYFEISIKLEDDVITINGFVTEIKNYVSHNEKIKKKWMLINFSELGFIGKLFRNYDLPVLINIFLSFASFRPIDLLPGFIFEILTCHPNQSRVNTFSKEFFKEQTIEKFKK
jgi:hypothetical protein